MPDDERIASQQQSLLAAYRQTLAHLVRQAAMHGGEPFAPSVTANGLAEARTNIARIKAELHKLGLTVVDEPNDTPPPSSSHTPNGVRREQRNITTGGGDYAEGNIDKRSGIFAAPGSTVNILPGSLSTEPPSSPAPTQRSSGQAERTGAHAFSCFVSYSHHDEAFVQQLVTRLRNVDLNVWYANDDMRAGVKLYDQITEAIRRQDKLLVVLSEHSIASEWVTTEIRRARREESETNQRKLFPIRLVDMTTLRRWEAFDADVGKDLAVEVREYFIPDFSIWPDPNAFETALTRLLKALQAST